MVENRNGRLLITALLGVALWLTAGCVYWNTFYNAKKAFNEAEKWRKAASFGAGRVKTDLYEKAIDKSLKVVEHYPNSKYYDDALFVLGASYFYLKRYVASERRLRELLANYGDSEYAKEAELYLAKVKLERQDEEEAMAIFERVFGADFKKSFKGEAAVALGNYHFENGNFGQARTFFQALRDSLGDDRDKCAAQQMIADSYFNDFKFSDALGSYLQMLGMEPDKKQKYSALYGAAMSSFRLMKIEDGLDYLRTLAGDEVYFDSVGVIRLRMAEGYEYDEDMLLAEDIYREVLEQEANSKVAAEAAYRLGLMYQFEYDDLPQAKEFYDQTVKLSRASEFGQDALTRSADIGKIETFKRTLTMDSTTTQEMIDEAAYTQYQLAELYWSKLGKPDSAMTEMQYVIDSFPNSRYAAKAMIALSQMYMEHKEDPYTSYDMLKSVPKLYPNSDYLPEALEALEMKGGSLDTGYARIYLDKAEYFLADEQNIDSARSYYRFIVDNYPDSKYAPQAELALIWITETYTNPGDSSTYYAYLDFIDAYPGNPWAAEAEKIVAADGSGSATEGSGDTTDVVDDEVPRRAEEDFLFGGEAEAEKDTTLSLDPLVAVYIGPNGDSIYNCPIEPVEIREEFIYPVEAYNLEWEGALYFQILLDFSGEVTDYVLKIRCESEEINREASKAVASMVFDPLRIPQEQQGKYMVYKFQVRRPDHLR